MQKSTEAIQSLLCGNLTCAKNAREKVTIHSMEHFCNGSHNGELKKCQGQVWTRKDVQAGLDSSKKISCRRSHDQWDGWVAHIHKKMFYKIACNFRIYFEMLQFFLSFIASALPWPFAEKNKPMLQWTTQLNIPTSSHSHKIFMPPFKYQIVVCLHEFQWLWNTLYVLT